MDLRKYNPDTDRAGCLSLREDRAKDGEFDRFLDSQPSHFWVVDLGGQLGACGGFDASTGELVWGMVRPDLERKGLGRYLLLFRLKELGKVPGLVTVRAVVPAAYARFYEKNGMKLAGISGDTAEFRMKLQVCTS